MVKADIPAHPNLLFRQSLTVCFQWHQKVRCDFTVPAGQKFPIAAHVGLNSLRNRTLLDVNRRQCSSQKLQHNRCDEQLLHRHVQYTTNPLGCFLCSPLNHSEIIGLFSECLQTPQDSIKDSSATLLLPANSHRPSQFLYKKEQSRPLMSTTHRTIRPFDDVTIHAGR